LAKLTITWSEINNPKVTTGAGSAADAVDMSTARAMLTADDRQYERPFVVYLTSSEEKHRVEQENVDATALKDERVSLSARLFTMVKTDANAIGESHPFARFVGSGGNLPRLVAFSANGQEIGRLEGTVSPSKLFQLMKKTAIRDYVVNVDNFVKDYQKILTELDKLDTLRKALADKESRKKTAADEREIALKTETYDKQEAALKEKEEKLLAVKRKAELAAN
jgi:hypothetical protein